MTEVRTLAFADLQGGPWGATWLPGSDDQGMLAARVGEAAETVSITLEEHGPANAWTLTGDGSSLRFSPLGPTDENGGAVADSGFDQLCSVTGQLTLESGEHEIDCLGWRSDRAIAPRLDRIQSFRQVAAWFDGVEGMALLAVRPAKTKGHDADVMAASVLEPEQALAVADPRMSTTYTSAGLPARAGLELWIDPEPAENDSQETQYPRRASGEVVDGGLDWTVEGFELHAQPLRWHSRGSEGAGIYLLGRR